MKILLINPLTQEKRMIHNTPNLGLGYLATALRNAGFQVDICDGMKKDMSYEKLKDRLSMNDYDVAGVQVLTCSIKRSQEIIGFIKRHNPGITTIIGGPHPSGAPEQTLDEIKEADFAFRGEGDEGLPKLLHMIESNDGYDYKSVPNLIWRDNGKIKCNPFQPIENIGSIGIPSWDLINPQEYPYSPIGAFARRYPLATISLSRGCAHYCTFCANTRIMGRKLRTRNKESVLEEIHLLYDKYGIREFQVIDDSFTSDRENAIDVCKAIINSGLDISISFPNGIRIESLDKELVQYLEQAGCYSLGMAIESGSQRIIDHMRRGQTIELVEEQIKMVKSVSKIRMSGFFILGYPEEKEEDILKTIDLAKKLPLSRANFTLWMPVPGSEMTERLRDEGKLNNIDPDRVVINKISYVSENISRDKLKNYL